MGLVVLSLTIHSLLEMILLPPNLEPIISKETRKYVDHLIFQLHGERVIDHSISMAYLKNYLFQLPSEESRLRYCSGKDKYMLDMRQKSLEFTEILQSKKLTRNPITDTMINSYIRADVGDN